MQVTVRSFKAFEYVEVWKITEYRDGFILHTKSTGKYIKESDAGELPKGFTTSNISTRLLAQEQFSIDVVPASYFK